MDIPDPQEPIPKTLQSPTRTTRDSPSSIRRLPAHVTTSAKVEFDRKKLSSPVSIDHFGAFAYKDLPVLEKPNRDVIKKVREEALAEALAAQKRRSLYQDSGLQPKYDKPDTTHMGHWSSCDGGCDDLSPDARLRDAYYLDEGNVR